MFLFGEHICIFFHLLLGDSHGGYIRIEEFYVYQEGKWVLNKFEISFKAEK